MTDESLASTDVRCGTCTFWVRGGSLSVGICSWSDRHSFPISTIPYISKTKPNDGRSCLCWQPSH